MKKNRWKDFLKNNGMHAVVLAAIIVVVAVALVVAVQANITGEKDKDPIDLNEAPLDLSEQGGAQGAGDVVQNAQNGGMENGSQITQAPGNGAFADKDGDKPEDGAGTEDGETPIEAGNENEISSADVTQVGDGLDENQAGGAVLADGGKDESGASLEYDDYNGGAYAQAEPDNSIIYGDEASSLLPDETAEPIMEVATGPSAGTTVTDTPEQDAEEGVNSANNAGGTADFEAVMAAVDSLQFDPEQGILWPVAGNVVMNYSIDHVIYHETLNSYRTHPAILIEAAAGTEVRAAATGIVTNIEETYETGVTVTLSVGSEYALVYGQLQESALQIGDVVAEGEVLGVVGSPSRRYTLEGDSLYFQVTNGTETVNPMLLLREE